MFEYMCIGLPQVISDFPLYRSVVEKHDCGICVDPASAEEIATALEDLIARDDLILKMQANARSAASQYNWVREETKVFNLYEMN